MLKHVIVLLLLLVTTNIWGAKISEEERRNRILEIIDEELNEVTRLSKQRNNRDPELLLRAAELNLEKARLVRESENERFLALPAEQRRSADQDRAYAGSNRNFQVANQYATAVTKQFPKYKDIADVYYILAYNARELKQYDQAQKYFSLATKKAPKGSSTFHKSQLALADSLYNKAQFSKAIPLYESALSKLKETWWTKDSFNLAWCYYRVKNYTKAINLMKEIHQKSSDQRFINMSHFVERDLGGFFIEARRTDEAIKWYKTQNIDFSNHLIKIAKVLIAQGKFTQAEQLANEAASMQKTTEGRAEVLTLQLDLFDKFEKVPPHLKASEELTKLFEARKLDKSQTKILEYQVAKKAAELQKAASSDIYKNVKKTRELRARQANDYFSLLARLRPGQTAEPTFFKGETAYAAGKYTEAMDSYQLSYSSALKEKNTKVASQSMEGMLAALGQKEFPQALAEKYYIPVYTSYLAHDGSSARAKVIRQKLFKVYMSRNDVDNAEKVMSDYAKNYPDDFKTQEAMLAEVMEQARKKKDYSKVKFFVSEINNGTYKVSKKYADALRQLMTKIQIEGAQMALDKGDKSSALKSYIRIYSSTESTPRAKANAAYNLAALYYEAGDLPESYKWAVIALQEMDAKEAKQFSNSFLAISSNLFLRQRFQQSADLGARTVAKLCTEGLAAKNTAFKNSVFLWLAEGKIEKAEEVMALGARCGIDLVTMNEARIELAREYLRLKRWESLADVIKPVTASKSQAPLTIVYLESLRQTYIGLGDSAQAQQLGSQILSIYREAKVKNLDIPVEALDIIALGLMPKLEQKRIQLGNMKLDFPEQNFNQTVKLKLSILDSLTVDVNEIQKTGSGKGIVKAYKILVNSYERFAEELRLFSPEGKSPEYVESFRKAMSGVWTPILQTAQKRRMDVKQLIQKNTILAEDNFEMLAIQGAEVVPFYNKQGPMVLMDRGGIK
jgi:tetratricopeptide (TPR) repeat protein